MYRDALTSAATAKETRGIARPQVVYAADYGSMQVAIGQFMAAQLESTSIISNRKDGSSSITLFAQDQSGQDGFPSLRHRACSRLAGDIAEIDYYGNDLTVYHSTTQQERFRTAIHGFAEMVLASSKMVKAAQILSIPVFATEQNPKIRLDF